MLGSLGTSLLAVQVVLPDCDKMGSDWRIELKERGRDGKSQLLWRSTSPGKLGSFVSLGKQEFDINILQGDGVRLPSTLSMESTLREFWKETGLWIKGEFALSQSRYSNVELTVEYWPDR